MTDQSMSNSGPTDYYLTEDLLSDRERSARDAVRSWIDSRYLPKAADYFDQGIFPVELVPEMANLGLFGFKMKQHGGRDFLKAQER
jgi:glutaryl-CoA dehydrogenase